MTRVLVPVAVLDGESVSSGLMGLLGTVDVTVLGYHVVPDQTPPDQARLQFEDRATAALEDVVDEFRAAGGDADHRLVFTRDREQTVRRVAAETGSRAIALSGPTGRVDRLLVLVTGDVDVDRILSFVEALVGDRDIGVTLLHAGGGDTDAEAAEERLDAAGDRLADADIDARTERVSGEPFEAVVAAAADHDVVVMGEQAPSLQSALFGEAAERLAAASAGPVLVVRRDDGADEDPVSWGEGATTGGGAG